MEEQIFCIRSQDQVLEGAQEGHPGMVSVKYIPLRPKDQQIGNQQKEHSQKRLSAFKKESN
jgi:hypothetical protein